MSTLPDPLDPLFERWRQDTPPLPSSLRPEVWHRIEQAETNPGIRSWLARIELACSRPAFAAAFVAACVLLGLFLAETRINEHIKDRSADLERSYLRMLDPHLEHTPAIAPAFFQP